MENLNQPILISQGAEAVSYLIIMIILENIFRLIYGQAMHNKGTI